MNARTSKHQKNICKYYCSTRKYNFWYKVCIKQPCKFIFYRFRNDLFRRICY